MFPSFKNIGDRYQKRKALLQKRFSVLLVLGVEKLYYKKALDTSFLLKPIQDKKYRKMRHQV